jgi:hypothetical protein
MIPENLKCLGFKDMSPEQVQALLVVVSHALNLADDMDDPRIFAAVLDDVDDMVRLFGASGVTVHLKAELNP